jgi:GNAT superfamily N-acetyltransferase
VSAELELAEAESFASMFESAGLPVLRTAGAVCHAIPRLEGNTMLNRVTGLGLSTDPTDGDLDEIDAFFRRLGTAYGVAVSPLAPASLGPRLRERGFGDGLAWMKFRRGVEPAPASGPRLTVRECRDGAAFGRVVASAYGMPEAGGAIFSGLPGRDGWTLFLAWDGDEPVGGAALRVAAGVGWLGGAGTRPEHRGKGAQTALLAARVERARELGATAVTTETGEHGPGRPNGSYRNILRAGFAEAYLRPNLVSPG